MSSTIEQVLSGLDAFAAAARQKPGLSVSVDTGDPISSDRIDAFCDTHDVHIPADIRAFWERGPRSIHISLDDDPDVPFVAGMDFYTSMKLLDRDTPTMQNFRQSLAEYIDMDSLSPRDEEFYRLHDHGVPLSFSEPRLALDGDTSTGRHAIHRLLYDGESVVEPVAPDFTTFLRHWLAAACFTYGSFERCWQHLGDIAPGDIPRSDNLWLKYWDAQYDTDLAR